MILILSIKNDPCTEDVLSWLMAFHVSFIRINPEDIVHLEKFEIHPERESIIFEVNNQKVNLSQITSFWYRRGDLTFFKADLDEPNLNHYLHKELFVLQKFIYKKLESGFHINKRADNEINKLQSLTIARKVGLLIPSSEVTYDTNTTSITKDHKIITKAFRNGGYMHGKNYSVGAPTELVEDRISSAFPSFIQEAIPKKFRVANFLPNG